MNSENLPSTHVPQLLALSSSSKYSEHMQICSCVCNVVYSGMCFC